MRCVGSCEKTHVLPARQWPAIQYLHTWLLRSWLKRQSARRHWPVDRKNLHRTLDFWSAGVLGRASGVIDLPIRTPPPELSSTDDAMDIGAGGTAPCAPPAPTSEKPGPSGSCPSIKAAIVAPRS